MKAVLREVMYSETRAQVREAVRRFAAEYGPKYPEAVMALEKGRPRVADVLRLPRGALKHLRTSNVVLQALGHGAGALAATRRRVPPAVRAPR